VPWADLGALIEPVYAERMLRIYFLQQWFNLSDPGVEEALYDSAGMLLHLFQRQGPPRLFAITLKSARHCQGLLFHLLSALLHPLYPQHRWISENLFRVSLSGTKITCLRCDTFGEIPRSPEELGTTRGRQGRDSGFRTISGDPIRHRAGRIAD
jgi:hypothetical protein